MYVKTEAQMENSKLFMEMYNRYSNIAVTRYDWKNLPIGVNERLLNMSLYLVGKACFFEHEDYGLIALPCSNGSEYNLFYEPTRINAFSFGFTRTLSFGEFELVRNNPTGTPTALTVYTYIKRMMDVLRSIDVVCARMKRPYLILCEEKQKLTFINLLKRIKDNEDIVLAFKNYGIDKSNFEVAPLPSIGNIDQLWKTYRTYEDILYSAIGLDSKGDRSFTFYRNPGADVMLTSAEVNRNLIDDAAIFHFGSVSLTADPSRTATLEAARYARQQGKLVSFDPNYRPLLWEHPADAVVQMQEGVKLADLLKVSEEEMQLITNESDLARGSQALLEMGPSLVLVSLGAKGAYYRNAVGAGHLPTYDVPTVDTTGAGDAFMGAIHYQLRRKAAEDLRTLPAFELEEIVRFGNAAGSLTTTKGGAIPAMPSMVEIQNCIASIPLM